VNEAANVPSAATVPDSGVTSSDERIAYRADGGHPFPVTDTDALVLPQLTDNVGAYTPICAVAVCRPSLAVMRYVAPAFASNGMVTSTAKSPTPSAVVCTSGLPSSHASVIKALDHPLPLTVIGVAGEPKPPITVGPLGVGAGDGLGLGVGNGLGVGVGAGVDVGGGGGATVRTGGAVCTGATVGACVGSVATTSVGVGATVGLGELVGGDA